MNFLLYCGFSSTQRKSFIKFHLCSHLIWHRLILNRGLAEDQCHNQFLPWAQVRASQKMGCLPPLVGYCLFLKGRYHTTIWRRERMEQDCSLLHINDEVIIWAKSIDQVLIRCFLHHMFLRNQVVVKLICSLFYWILKFNWCYF